MCEDNGVILLNHEAIDIEGVKIFGSPWTPFFYDWAFNAGRTITEAAFHRKPFIGDLWATIPLDTNILVTHGPVYGILDELLYPNGDPKGQFVGDVELEKKIKEIKPDIHICGHVHCGYGQKHIDGTSYYNASICNEMYYPENHPHIIEYTKE
jgi:Icc-related predicted phosphoesterase